MDVQAREEFAAFLDATERRPRLALTGAFGMDTGHDAAAETLAWGWQNWDRVREMNNPVGYLYRVGRTAAVRAVGQDSSSVRSVLEIHPSSWELPDFEPNLSKFLAGLSEHQRVAVWMVHGLGFSHHQLDR